MTALTEQTGGEPQTIDAKDDQLELPFMSAAREAGSDAAARPTQTETRRCHDCGEVVGGDVPCDRCAECEIDIVGGGEA